MSKRKLKRPQNNYRRENPVKKEKSSLFISTAMIMFGMIVLFSLYFAREEWIAFSETHFDFKGSAIVVAALMLSMSAIVLIKAVKMRDRILAERT